jgi:hypothetical protein
MMVLRPGESPGARERRDEMGKARDKTFDVWAVTIGHGDSFRLDRVTATSPDNAIAVATSKLRAANWRTPIKVTAAKRVK